MKSVLIKGMKMPAAGAYNCELGVIDENTATLTIHTPINESQRSYKLVTIPTHGDLIDRDALIDVLYHGSKKISEIQRGVKDEKTISYCQGIMVGYANSRIALDGAPVVIPAERSEE